MYPAGRIGGPLEERDGINNTAEGSVGGLLKIKEVRIKKGFCLFGFLLVLL